MDKDTLQKASNNILDGLALGAWALGGLAARGIKNIATYCEEKATEEVLKVKEKQE